MSTAPRTLTTPPSGPEPLHEFFLHADPPHPHCLPPGLADGVLLYYGRTYKGLGEKKPVPTEIPKLFGSLQGGKKKGTELSCVRETSLKRMRLTSQLMALSVCRDGDRSPRSGTGGEWDLPNHC